MPNKLPSFKNQIKSLKKIRKAMGFNKKEQLWILGGGSLGGAWGIAFTSAAIQAVAAAGKVVCVSKLSGLAAICAKVLASKGIGAFFISKNFCTNRS